VTFHQRIISLAVELGFGQKFKPDPRVGQIRQPNPRVEQPESEETEPVTYKFLGFGQKILFKPESWTEIFVQPEDWIGSGCSTCSKPNPAVTLRIICFLKSFPFWKVKKNQISRLVKRRSKDEMMTMFDSSWTRWVIQIWCCRWMNRWRNKRITWHLI
jgi:hypothetical protein